MAPGTIFNYTAHSNVPGILPGETESIPIRDFVAELLGCWPSLFEKD